MDDLSGRSAVITGGASGIGLATACRLAAEGVRVLLADIEDAPLKAAATALGVPSVHCDVGNIDDVVGLADIAFAEFGTVDILFSNAGVALHGDIVSTSHADWEWIVRVNLWGPIHGVEAFLPRMVAQQTGGHLLFTASFAGLVPNLGLGPYCVTKYGVVALAEVLQRELRPHGIGVSVLCPMRVETNIGSSARNRPAANVSPDVAVPTRTEGPPPEAERAGRVLSVDLVADDVVRALKANRLYIVPHAESRESVRRRFGRIDQAYDEDPVR